jgi:hypothetical protein
MRFGFRSEKELLLILLPLLRLSRNLFLLPISEGRRQLLDSPKNGPKNKNIKVVLPLPLVIIEFRETEFSGLALQSLVLFAWVFLFFWWLMLRSCYISIPALYLLLPSPTLIRSTPVTHWTQVVKRALRRTNPCQARLFTVYLMAHAAWK